MEIEFDPAKDKANRAKHGISLAAAADMDFDRALVVEDKRVYYGERRYVALGVIGNRLHAMWFTMRGSVLRVIGIQKPTAEKGIDMSKGSTRRPAKARDIAVPELSDEELRQAVPFKQAFPKQHESWKRGRGRPRSLAPKKMLAVRLRAGIVDHIKATKGYTARLEKVLQRAIDRGAL